LRMFCHENSSTGFLCKVHHPLAAIIIYLERQQEMSRIITPGRLKGGK